MIVRYTLNAFNGGSATYSINDKIKRDIPLTAEECGPSYAKNLVKNDIKTVAVTGQDGSDKTIHDINKEVVKNTSKLIVIPIRCARYKRRIYISSIVKVKACVNESFENVMRDTIDINAIDEGVLPLPLL